MKEIVDLSSGQGAFTPTACEADFAALEAEVAAAVTRFLRLVEQRLQDPAARGLLEKHFLWWLFEPLDRELSQVPLLKGCIDVIERTGAHGVDHLQKKHKSTCNRYYLSLGPNCRDAVRRLLRWPRAETTLHRLLSERAWIRFAASFSSQSRFDDKGSGQYVRARQPELYARMVEANAAAWSHHVGADGHRYESRAELIIANLLHCNRHMVSYAPHPLLQIRLPRSQRSMQADFRVVPLHAAGACEPLLVECWGRRLTIDPAVELKDTYVAWTLMRRRFKTARRDLYPGRLLEIEADVLRESGAEAFVTHCREQFRSAGIELSADGVVCESRHCPMPDEVDAEEIARQLHGAGHRSVNSGTKDGSRRVRALAYSAVRRRIVHEVERQLAALARRAPRIRMARGTCATREDVERVVKEHSLDKATYGKLYGEGSLPAGFPASPRQQWKDWCWYRVRGDGVMRRDLVLDYEPAKRVLTEWQSRHVKITGPTAYERARKAYPELHVLPKQPDNRKAGGLRGWISWDDFLGSSSSKESRQKDTAAKALVMECRALPGAGAVATWLVAKGLTSYRSIQAHSNQLVRYCSQRTDWPEILAMLPDSRRLPSWTFQSAAAELARAGCLSWEDYRHRRESDERLRRLPKKIHRLGRGIFAAAEGLAREGETAEVRETSMRPARLDLVPRICKGS